MISFSTARSLVEKELLALAYDSKPENKLAIIDNLTQDIGVGWVFFYEMKAYLETKNELYRLYGAGPIIVDKEDGALYHTGSAKLPEEYISEFREKKKRGTD